MRIFLQDSGHPGHGLAGALFLLSNKVAVTSLSSKGSTTHVKPIKADGLAYLMYLVDFIILLIKDFGASRNWKFYCRLNAIEWLVVVYTRSLGTISHLE